jgi:aminoglycoside 6'-N-acetyltransferase I
MKDVRIRTAQRGDAIGIAELMSLLWPDGSLAEFHNEAASLIETGMCGTLPAVVLLGLGENDELVGFLQAGLRSHADGCDVSRPVGFIEGWFVRAEWRGLGVGRALMDAAEQWCRTQGCREVASDALLDNPESLRAHGALGFEVVDRCVHFRKAL